MNANWIDFKALRGMLDFETVLRHYQVEVKRRGDQHMGFCPLPTHNGKRNSPSFSANLAKGIWQCFGCGARGNILEFAALMEGVRPEDKTAFHGVALKLQKQFCRPADSRPNPAPAVKKEIPAKPVMPIVVNAPLDFELKGLDASHPYLLGRGFTLETLTEFGVGFCSRGSLKDRVAFPLRDNLGQLVGYAGRVTNEGEINEDNPRYRFPGSRERDGTIFEFKKSLFLYNGHRFKTPLDEIILVEGFTATWWLHQNGYPNVVATMGVDISDAQADLLVSLVKPSGRIWLLPDGDDPGRRLAQSSFLQLSPERFVRWVKLEEGAQPTDLSVEHMNNCFNP